MGTRLLPSLYRFFENSSQPIPFLDILNRLEQLGVITSVEDWQFFRNLRNNLAHDYPESVDQTVLTLNALYSKWRHMEELYHQARKYYQSRKIPSSTNLLDRRRVKQNRPQYRPSQVGKD